MNRTLRAIDVAWPVLVLLVAWQAWIALGHVPAIVAPSPAAVVRELVAHPDVYASAAATTLGASALGLVAGTLLGSALALAVWLAPAAEALMTFPALLVQATPLVALVPVFGRLFGYGEPTVLAAAIAITFLPTFVLVAAGLRAVPPGGDALFAVLGAARTTRLLHLALPAAVPNLLIAIRIAAANSILAALVAEYLVGNAGLGRVLADAQSQFLTPRAWSASLVATVLSVAAYAAARRAERLGAAFTL